MAGGRARAATPYTIEVADGVPFLIEFGVPQGTGFHQTGQSGQERKRISLNGEWHFRIDPLGVGEREVWMSEKVDFSLWDTHSVPSVWQATDPNLRSYNGVAWYRTTFKAPEDIAGAEVFLKFEGVFLFAKVWLNGKPLGEHEGGYTPFRFDVTGAIKPGAENVLTVACDNRLREDSVPPIPELGAFGFLEKNAPSAGSPLLRGKTHLNELGWWPYGGIHGDVYLEAVPQINIVKAVVAATPSGDGGNLNVEGVVWNTTDTSSRVVISCELKNSTGESILKYPCGAVQVAARGFAGFRSTAAISGVRPWSPSEPNLYDLTVEIESAVGKDSVVVETGFRKFEVLGTSLVLNGKEIFLYGVGRQEDDPAVGLAQTPTVISNDLDMIQDLGANFIRPGNHPAHTAFLDECDRRGILLVEEIPLSRASGNQFSNPIVLSRAKLQLFEMIERDINRPSVVIWSLGDEAWSFAKSAGDMVSELKVSARKMDPARPVTMALLVVPHLTNHRDFIASEMDILFINEYFGWYYGESADVARYLAFVNNNYPNKPIVISGLGTHALSGFKDPDRQRVLSEDWQASYMLTHLKLLGERKYVSGVVVSSFADYRSPWYAEKESYSNMSISGLVDQRRVPKRSYYALQDFYKKWRASQGKGG